MMNLTDIIGMAAKNPKVVTVLAQQFGLNEGQAGQAASALLGALAGGVQKNVQSNGLNQFTGALEKGAHDRYLDNPDDLPQAEEEGNKILGHLLGSKDASREVAQQVGTQTGVNSDIVKKMLPLVAMAAMGAMSKSRQQQGSAGFAAGLGSLLDQDGDGNPVNDILGMLSGKKSA